MDADDHGLFEVIRGNPRESAASTPWCHRGAISFAAGEKTPHPIRRLTDHLLPRGEGKISSFEMPRGKKPLIRSVGRKTRPPTG